LITIDLRGSQPGGEIVAPDRRRTDDGFENRILSALPRESVERLAANLETVDLFQGDILGHSDASIDHLYFIHRGLVSLVKTLEDGQSIEVSTVGIEGMEQSEAEGSSVPLSRMPGANAK